MPSTEYRLPHLRAKLIDENMNSWSDFAGMDTNVDVAYRYAVGDGPDETSIEHWSYRGQAAMCQLSNNDIVRVRVGDGTFADRKLYIQTISDPTDPTEWTAWTTKYTGDHYAVAIVRDDSAPAGYLIYHSKSDGVYRDNVKVSPGSTWQVIRIKPVALGEPGEGYFQAVTADPDGNRQVWWNYSRTMDTELGTMTIFGDWNNYRWYHHDMLCVKVPDADWYRFRGHPSEGASRHKSSSDILTCEFATGDFMQNNETFNSMRDVRYLKGPSGQAGFKRISNLYMNVLPTNDGDAYFLFYNERHQDIAGNVLSNHKMPLYWSRSYGYPFYLSAPTPVGFSIWGFAGAIRHGDYIYVAGNGRVIRRYWPATETDITNYIKEGSYTNPRGNEKATGKLVCPNPGNTLGRTLGLVSDNAAGLTEHKLHLEVGIRKPGEVLTHWKRDNQWYLTTLQKIKTSDHKERLNINFADFWHRLENPFLDTISIPGHFTWNDWGQGGVNQLFNWFNDTDEMFRYSPAVDDSLLYTIPRLRTIISGDGPGGGTRTLFAGWRGEHIHIQATLWQLNTGTIFRYVDENNYMYHKVTGPRTEVHSVVEGADTLIEGFEAEFAIEAPYNVYIDVYGRFINITIEHPGGDTGHTIGMVDPPVFTGFIGFFSTSANGVLEVSNVVLYDFNVEVTTRELVKVLLCYADEHNIEIDVDDDDTDTKQLSLIWGPQSDLDDPAKALRQLLDSARIEAKWLPD
jgi:hypothetical protein